MRSRISLIIGNSRYINNEEKLLKEFAKRLNTKVITFIGRDEIINKAEINRKTVIEYDPKSKAAERYRDLATKIIINKDLTIPTPLDFADLELLVYEYGN